MRHKTAYHIMAALKEESNAGWVWVGGPELKDVKSRTVVKIKRPWHRGVYTDVRTIEENFLDQYNGVPVQRAKIQRNQNDTTSRDNTIVMGDWYRNGLGIGTTYRTSVQPVVVVKEVRGLRKISGFGSLRAACHHPDAVIRLGTRLGILGAWLGLLALTDPMLKVFYEPFDKSYLRLGSLLASFHMSGDTDYIRASATIAVAVATGIVALWLCRGRPKPLGK